MTHDPHKQQSNGPISWMAGNSVASNLLMAILLIGGLIVGANIKQEVFPEFTLDFVNISVPYPGASPEEVERGVILAVEEAVQGIDQVTRLSLHGQVHGDGRQHPATCGALGDQIADILRDADSLQFLGRGLGFVEGPDRAGGPSRVHPGAVPCSPLHDRSWKYAPARSSEGNRMSHERLTPS